MHTYQLASGSWRTIAQYDGKRVSASAATRRASELAAASKLAALGADTPTAGVTVGELLDVHLARQPIARSTRAEYKRVRRLHLPTDFEQRLVATIAPPAIDALYRRLEGAGVTAHRLVKLNAMLSGAFKRAVRCGWILANPCRDALLPSVGTPDTRAPETDEARALLAACDAISPAFGVFARLAAQSGGRPGELVALRRADVDVDKRTVAIERAISRAPGGWEELDLRSEGKRGRRTVAIGPALAQRIAAHELSQDIEADELGLPALGRSARLFSEDFAAPWYPGTPSHWWRQARDAVGITDVRLYDLRHYVATEIIAAGWDDQTSMRRLGHSNPHTGAKRYAHARPVRDRAAAEQLERALEDD